MLKNTSIFVLTLFIFMGSAYSYEIEKEGKYWYVYSGDDIVGSYAYRDLYGAYQANCGSPMESVYDNIYIHKRGQTYFMDTVSTKREAKNLVINNCVKR